MESGEDQREERTLTWMTMQMGEVKCGQDSFLSQCECDEMCKEQDYVCTLSGTVCGCARCEAPRNRRCAVSSSLSTSSLVFTLSCFSSRLLLYTLSS